MVGDGDDIASSLSADLTERQNCTASSATLIGFTHPHPPAGALILAQPAIKVIVTKSGQMGTDFDQTFASRLFGFVCR
jgi:hypothetical protein